MANRFSAQMKTRLSRARARATIAGFVVALASLVPWHPAHAANPPQQCAESPDSQSDNPVAKYRMFGLHLDMTEADARCVIIALADGASCTGDHVVPGPDDTCWNSSIYRENERVLEGRKSMALRSALPGKWAALLRVYFSGAPPTASSDERQKVSKVYRIEWLVYWTNPEQWLATVRDRMRDRSIGNIDNAGLGLKKKRRILDHGAIHHYEWKAPAQEKELKSYIALDISYAPQISVLVSRGEYEEVYAPRVAALKKSQNDEAAAEGEVQDFLTKPSADDPWLPLPQGVSK